MCVCVCVCVRVCTCVVCVVCLSVCVCVGCGCGCTNTFCCLFNSKKYVKKSTSSKIKKSVSTTPKQVNTAPFILHIRMYVHTYVHEYYSVSTVGTYIHIPPLPQFPDSNPGVFKSYDKSSGVTLRGNKVPMYVCMYVHMYGTHIMCVFPGFSYSSVYYRCVHFVSISCIFSIYMVQHVERYCKWCIFLCHTHSNYIGVHEYSLNGL